MYFFFFYSKDVNSSHSGLVHGFPHALTFQNDFCWYASKKVDHPNAMSVTKSCSISIALEQ